MRDGVRDLAFEMPSGLAVVGTFPAKWCRTLSHFTMPLASTSPPPASIYPAGECHAQTASPAAGAARARWLRHSVLTPVYSERVTAELNLDHVHLTPFQKEIVVVDECSRDGTRDPLREFFEEAPIDRLRLQRVNCSKKAAIHQTLSMSTGDVVILFER